MPSEDAADATTAENVLQHTRRLKKRILMVAKKDARREVFDRNKILNGIVKACEKRPVSMTQIEGMVDDIEKTLNNLMEKEVTSDYIGELVMEQLKKVDEVAYVRFASVYRQFTDGKYFHKRN